MKKVLLALLFALLVLPSCGGKGGFEIIEKPVVDSVGFLDPDTLQIIGIGYPSPAQNDPPKQKEESLQAADINARMLVIEFFVSQLIEAKDEDKYKALASRIGNFSPARYEPIYGKELLAGGSTADALLDMLGVRGYAFKVTYDPKTLKTWVAYRVIRAGLLGMAKSGFTQ